MRQTPDFETATTTTTTSTTINERTINTTSSRKRIVLTNNKWDFILVVVFLLLLSTVPEASCRKKRRNNFYRSMQQRQSFCQVTPVTVVVHLRGCIATSVTTLGCHGNCLSDTTIDIHKRSLITKCHSCKPYRETTVEFVIPCRRPRQHLVYKRHKIFAATRCRCQPCMRHSQGPVLSTFHKNKYS